MRLFLDTHALAWFGAGHSKLSQAARTAISSENSDLAISAVIAFEYSDLVRRNRLGGTIELGVLIRDLEIELVDYPAKAWRFVNQLPSIHRDPVDRMLIAHAIVTDATLVTADAAIQRYPVKWLW